VRFPQPFQSSFSPPGRKGGAGLGQAPLAQMSPSANASPSKQSTTEARTAQSLTLWEANTCKESDTATLGVLRASVVDRLAVTRKAIGRTRPIVRWTLGFSTYVVRRGVQQATTPYPFLRGVPLRSRDSRQSAATQSPWAYFFSTCTGNIFRNSSRLGVRPYSQSSKASAYFTCLPASSP
jgi:hypothetical protein